jgi:hypothetical protein
MLMWSLVAVCGHDCPKFACLAKDFSLVKPTLYGEWTCKFYLILNIL